MLPIAEAEALAAAVLVKAGVARENAWCVAQALVAADADGIASHGLARLPAYADQAASGKVDGKAVPIVRQTGPAALMADAADGFAFPAIRLGLGRARRLVRETGIVGLGIANSHHFGVAGHHIEPLAADGLLAVALGNSPAAIAAWGGKRALFGTNPIAFAAPRAAGPPIVVDLSLAKAARGKVVLAAQRGEPIPPGWALDRDGRPTTDAQQALGGTMLAIGEVKGYGLVLMVEILAAALTGARFGYEASSFFDAAGSPPRVGQFFMIIDPQRFAGPQVAARIDALASVILRESGTRLPGSRRITARAKAQAGGISISRDLHEVMQRRLN